MTILDKIIQQKFVEVATNKEVQPISQLEKSIYFNRTVNSFKQAICHPLKNGVIAEFKRQSPSKGIINNTSTVEEVVEGYAAANVSAISVLTDTPFFGGKNADLLTARHTLSSIPFLRKDFIVSEYQLIEAKAIGADVILLIAACLEKKRVQELAQFAHSLGLEVLMEVHNEEELDKVNPYLDVVGVNNRNLKTFEVSIQTSIDLYSKIPTDFVKISESGISEIAPIKALKAVGYQGFLIGENFMKTAHPGKACADFVQQF